jgi:hypothetical protein
MRLHAYHLHDLLVIRPYNLAFAFEDASFLQLLTIDIHNPMIDVNNFQFLGRCQRDNE